MKVFNFATVNLYTNNKLIAYRNIVTLIIEKGTIQ